MLTTRDFRRTHSTGKRLNLVLDCLRKLGKCASYFQPRLGKSSISLEDFHGGGYVFSAKVLLYSLTSVLASAKHIMADGRRRKKERKSEIRSATPKDLTLIA